MHLFKLFYTELFKYKTKKKTPQLNYLLKATIVITATLDMPTQPPTNPTPPTQPQTSKHLFICLIFKNMLSFFKLLQLLL